MKENFTDIRAVVDRSGSMQSMKIEMENAFNVFIEGQRKDNLLGECRCTLGIFDTVYETVYKNLLVESVPKLQIAPRGGTALYDAICKAIIEARNDYSLMSEADRPAKKLFIIITDGQENMSMEFRLFDVQAMIKDAREKDKMEFVFLGANIDSVKVATTLGMNASNAYNFTADSVSTAKLAASLTRGVSNYRGQSDVQVNNLLNIESNELMTVPDLTVSSKP